MSQIRRFVRILSVLNGNSITRMVPKCDRRVHFVLDLCSLGKVTRKLQGGALERKCM